MDPTAEPLATCDECKLSSPLVDLFQPMRRRGKRISLCPACVAEETRRSGAGALIVVAFAIIVGGAVAALGGKTNAGWVFLNLALLTVMMWIITIPHEAGHALAARLLGLRVDRIVLGTGPLLRTFVIRDVPIDVHALPIGGLTYPEVRDEPTARVKRIVVTAAGPAVEFALLWAAFRFGGDAALAEQWSGGPAPITAFIAACILGLIANLLPLRAHTHAGAMGNDGAQLLWLLFSRRLPFAEMAWAMTIQRAQLLIVHGEDLEAERFARSALKEHAADPYLLVALSAAVLNQHRYGEGRALLVPLLERPDLHKKVVAVASNNLAWANLHLPDPALIAESRALSATAYGLMPWEAYVASTYACVEALHGDAHAALAASQRALAAPRRLKKRAPALGAAAVAHARLHQWTEATSALADAEAVDSDCPFLRIVRERIALERRIADATGRNRTHRAEVDMPQYLAPGVEIGEVSVGPPAIEGVATAVCLFVGPTVQSPQGDDAQRVDAAVESFLDFERRYGGREDLQTANGPWPNYLAHAAHAFFNNGGRRLYIARTAPESSAADYAAALDAARAFTDVSIVAAPGYSARADALAIQQVLLGHVQAGDHGGGRFAVLDAPPRATAADVAAIRQGADSAYTALYYPWVVVDDPRGATDATPPSELSLPPSGFVCGVYARVDATRGVWRPPANEPLIGVSRLERVIDSHEHDALNRAGVNCLRSFPGRGLLLWGARTLSSDQEWKYVNVRRYVTYLERSIDAGLQWVVFEQNDEPLWAAVRLTVSNFLLDNWRGGALMGTSADEAFFVKCDATTMTQDDIDSGRLIGLIGVALLKPAEFVIFRIGQWTASRCESC